ncbi:hypothetical protein Micbo1qcDRAFT_196943 [Microdochium bolleyi]|uniref:DUF7730 domain-containing protein n=1 Tax=Microdochium bolleyi TaxID=196109 RepID=A0A136IVY6_9PEZI|nr:hypothetical protein Micbo1qcDRAFT_196943 [Microdochium bolleyi]
MATMQPFTAQRWPVALVALLQSRLDSPGDRRLQRAVAWIPQWLARDFAAGSAESNHQASGPQQHIFQRPGGGRVTQHGSTSPGDAPQLTHFPCCKTEDDDAEIAAEHDHILEARQRSRSRTSAYFVDEVWSSRFDSPWLDHWRCEEAMREEDILQDFSGDGSVRPARYRTLFLPMLLCCRRMYHEALSSMYANTSFIYTDLSTAHLSLASLPSPTTSLVRSLNLSFALPYDTMHQHRYYSSPGVYSGPWAELCVALSNMVRFDSLRSVRLRLDLADGSSTRSVDSPPHSPTSGNFVGGRGNDSAAGSRSANASASSLVGTDYESRMWWQVRERWVLSPIRGMLARRLTVQLPERRRSEGARVSRRRPSLPAPTATDGAVRGGAGAAVAQQNDHGPADDDESPDWMRPYQYRDGDKTPFSLQRYRRCRLPKVGIIIVPGTGSRSGASSGPSSPKSLFGGPKSPRAWSAEVGQRLGSAKKSGFETSVVSAANDDEEGAAVKTVQGRLKALMKGRARD